MTREEAKEEILDYMKSDCYLDAPSNEACEIAVKALRPVIREQVDKVWRGEWKITYDEGKEKTIVVCSKCGEETVYDFILESDELVDFCPVCGAPMTDEAVQMVIERLEALKDAVL